MTNETLPHYSAGKYAVRHVDNWDGEGCITMSFANLDQEGMWRLADSGEPLLVYKGDKVLQAWPLEVSATPTAEIVGVKRAWLSDCAEELVNTAHEGGTMDAQIKTLLELHPRPKASI